MNVTIATHMTAAGYAISVDLDTQRQTYSIWKITENADNLWLHGASTPDEARKLANEEWMIGMGRTV